jgi:hypothetical protein
VCFPGFHGEVCSLILSQAPRLERDAFEGLCDKRKRKCHTFVIPGSDFIADGNLTCKFTAFSVSLNLELNSLTTNVLSSDLQRMLGYIMYYYEDQ